MWNSPEEIWWYISEWNKDIGNSMAEHFEEGEHGYAIIVCILNDLDKKDIDINILKYKFLKCLKCNFLPFTII